MATETLETLLKRVIHWSVGASLVLSLDCKCRDENTQCDSCRGQICDTCVQRCDSCGKEFCFGCVIQCRSCLSMFCKAPIISCDGEVRKCDYCSLLTCLECLDVCELCDRYACESCAKTEFKIVKSSNEGKSWRERENSLCHTCDRVPFIPLNFSELVETGLDRIFS